MLAARKIRILYLIDYWGNPGGTERHLAYLLKSLDRKRFECRVIVFNYLPNALAEEVRASGIPVEQIRVARYYTPSAMRQAGVLRRYMRKHAIDIVQAFHFKSDVYGAVVARFAGVRHFISSKRDAADFKKGFHFLLNQLVRPLTEHYIAVSGVVADVIRRREGVPEERISIIYNGVDLEQHMVPDHSQRSAARAALGLGPEHFVVGMSAWFRPEKDHALLLEAFRKLWQKSPRAHLVLIGGGPLLEYYRQQIARSALAGFVTFSGAVEDVRPWLRALDVACLVPAMNEGFSNSVLEKMATGLPVIATHIGGNAEAVENGRSGFVIPPRDLSALESALITLYNDTELRLSMGRVARQRAEELFSLRQMILHHESVYESLLLKSRKEAP